MSHDWKPELDAIVGARHGGRTDTVLPALRRLDASHPHVPEIAAELAFTLAAMGKPAETAEALAAYERTLALGLPSPAEQANTLAGHAVCLLRLGRAADAVVALERARAQFPDHAEFAAYLAVAQHRAGASDAAFALLLTTLLETSEDIGLAAHQRTLRSLLG
jgi:thioredoxin-like negative regulator of GroEL